MLQGYETPLSINISVNMFKNSDLPLTLVIGTFGALNVF